MTRDVTRPLTPERYTVRLAGLHGKRATVNVYDPLTAKTVLVHADRSDATSLTITLTATDYPRLLTVQER